MPAIVRCADIPAFANNIAPIHAPGYGPINIPCPADTVWLRKANSLGTDEQAYVDKRADHLATAWTAQTHRVGLTTAPPRTPVVAMALSGGGYRAMLSGSGMAFAPPSADKDDVGDILGLSTYVSGLSGGSWALGSFYANNGTSPQDLVENVRTVFTCDFDLHT
jgi:lysophospholipase